MGEFERKSLKKHINSSAYHLSKQYLVPYHIKKSTKMAFYIFEQPAMDQYHPKFYHTFRRNSNTSNYWNFVANLLKETNDSIQNKENCFSRKCLKRSAVNNSTKESKTENQVENACKENQSLEPVTKKAFRRFMSKVSYNETLEKIEIKIQFHGHEFKSEHLDVQIIDEKLVVVTAEDSEEKFEKKFQLPSNALTEKIDSKLEMKDKDIQTLIVNIPKDVKIVKIPINVNE